jgi:predicted dithiol-disulfide oxidoreductase (DUF899 family)
MHVTFPGESAEYRAARQRLLDQEIELRRATEAVAEARRALPAGGVVPQDYVFAGAEGPVRLSELFAPGLDSLGIYHFMFPRHPEDDRPGEPEGPCPSCVAFLDQLDGAVDHVSQSMNLAIMARAPIDRVLAFASQRGWRRLRLLSAAGTSFSRDYLAEDEAGASMPMFNVFRRTEGAIRHFWGSEMLYAPSDPGQDPRHMGTLEPLWNVFDLTPAGRPDWNEQLDYCCH